VTAAVAWRGATVRRGGRAIVDGVDLDVPEGGLVALVGPNGAGKTTLLRLALALDRPDDGQVEVGGRDAAHLAPRARAGALGWLPQRPRTPDPIPAASTVASARFRFDEPRARAVTIAREALERVGVGHLADRPVDGLSGGEAQRVALAALVAQDAATWLLDEPANHLDPAVQVALYGFLGDAWRAGRTIVCVTHDVNLLAHLGDPADVRVVGLDDGRLAFDHRLDEPALVPALGTLFRLPAHAVAVAGRRHVLFGAPGDPP
jgi:iron complex transport system ATP-binding protein